MHFMGKKEKKIQVYYTPIFFSLSIPQVIPHTEQFKHKGNFTSEVTVILFPFLLFSLQISQHFYFKICISRTPDRFSPSNNNISTAALE